jgi:septal ring factor EnvC (AmiA/AmiB activator)
VKRPRTVIQRASIPAAIASLLLLAGCATMAGWVGIASEAQVEEVEQKASATETRLAATEAQLAAANAEIDRLETELESYKERAGRLESLTDDLEDAIRSTRELEQLAEVMEARLQQLPQDTLRLLVEIIQKQLEDRPPEP